MTNRLVPEIRFKGFLDDWNLDKLGQSVRFLNGRAYKQKELLDQGKYKVIRVGNFNTNDRWYFSDLELPDNKYVNPGDLLYLWATNFGPEIWHGERAIYHYHIWKLEILDGNLDKRYLYTWLETDKERIKSNTNGTTMVHVTKGNIESREFQVPSNIIEQQKIGEFFKQLDYRIALQQRHVEQLKQSKQGFLQKMFPKDGESVPEVRFEGFSEEWGYYKLGDMKDVRDGTHESPKYQLEGRPLVTSKNLKDNGLDLNEVSLISNLDFEAINRRSKVNVGDILFGMIGTVGNPVLIERDDFAIKNVALIKENEKVKNQFLNQLLKSPVFDKYIQREIAGNTQKFLGLSKIRNFQLHIPIVEEQQKIGDFFKQLDDLIAKNERELELLQETKRGFLQKMFV